jgi:hypothetical protein
MQVSGNLSHKCSAFFKIFSTASARFPWACGCDACCTVSNAADLSRYDRGRLLEVALSRAGAGAVACRAWAWVSQLQPTPSAVIAFYGVKYRLFFAGDSSTSLPALLARRVR